MRMLQLDLAVDRLEHSETTFCFYATPECQSKENISKYVIITNLGIRSFAF